MQRFQSLIDQHTNMTPELCPNIARFVWFGSPLRESHRSRLANFRKLNPSFQMKLRYDSRLLTDAEKDELYHYAAKLKITLMDLADRTTAGDGNQDLVKFVLQLNKSKVGIVNYSIPSDIIRLIDLQEDGGGWYFDSDIEHLQPLPLAAPLPVHFRCYLTSNRFNQVTSQSPCVIMSTPQSAIISKALDVMKAFYNDAELKSAIESLGNAKIAQTRRTAATFSTGSLLEIALMHLQYKGEFCFNMRSGRCVHSELAQQLTAFVNDGLYINLNEASYVFGEKRSKLPGIEEYESYGQRGGNYDDISVLRERVLDYFYHFPNTVLFPPKKILEKNAVDSCIKELCQFDQEILTLEKLSIRLDDCKLLQEMSPFKGNVIYTGAIKNALVDALIAKLKSQHDNSDDVINLYQTARNHGCFAEPKGFFWGLLFSPTSTPSEQKLESILAVLKNNAPSYT